MMEQSGATIPNGDMKQHQGWKSRFGFLMAAIGFAVGLGNIWRFPYVTGENGGGAFVLVYIICAFGIAVPILIAEMMIGRCGKLSPPATMRVVATSEGHSPQWSKIGGMNLLTAFLIEIIYCVIAGWVLMYLFKAIVTGFAGVDAVAAEQQFSQMLGSTWEMLFWTIMGLAITGFIVYAGVQDGIERVVSFLMPVLFSLLVLLIVYNFFSGGFSRTLEYLFWADFSKVSGKMVLAAVGQAFFSIGVAMAGMMIYGAYLPRHISIPESAAIIVFADTLVALLAGLVIFPVVFKYGLDPQGGTGLIFQTLPVAFAQMPGGHLISVLFFLLLSVAAITSMVGLIEPLTAWMEEHRGWARHKSALAVTASVAALSLISILSYNSLKDLTLLDKNFNDGLSYLTDQIMLPLGGLLLAVFAGWFIGKKRVQEELNLPVVLYEIWHILIRFVVPVAVLLIFILGVLQ